MKKIKLGNGDFITLDEKTYPQQERRVEPQAKKEKLSVTTEVIVISLGLILGFALKNFFEQHRSQEKIIKD